MTTNLTKGRTNYYRETDQLLENYISLNITAIKLNPKSGQFKVHESHTVTKINMGIYTTCKLTSFLL